MRDSILTVERMFFTKNSIIFQNEKFQLEKWFDASIKSNLEQLSIVRSAKQSKPRNNSALLTRVFNLNGSNLRKRRSPSGTCVGTNFGTNCSLPKSPHNLIIQLIERHYRSYEDFTTFIGPSSTLCIRMFNIEFLKRLTSKESFGS